jgi:hypothetical protein
MFSIFARAGNPDVYSKSVRSFRVILPKFFCSWPTDSRTARLHYRDQTVNTVTEIIAVYSENNTKHTYTHCASLSVSCNDQCFLLNITLFAHSLRG